jgi:D-sedoheptulose 7-phosphate isomerase
MKKNKINNTINNYFNKLKDTIDLIDKNQLIHCITLIKNKISKNKSIYICGNGGSALTSSHYVTDWSKFYNTSSDKKISCFSLVDNMGLLTAYSNDYSYEEVFSGQLKSILKKNDLLISVSGSGNSKNLINAVLYAKKIKAETLSIVGYDGGKLKKISDFCLHIPVNDMQISEDIHLVFGHLVMKSITEK